MAIDEALIRAVVAGNKAAQQALLVELAPRIERIASSHPELRKRGLAALPDDIAEVRVATLERLTRDGHKSLARYLAQLEQPAAEAAAGFDN